MPYDALKDRLLKLSETDSLSHAYIFFGDKDVGKLDFALKFGNFLEFGKWELSERPALMSSRRGRPLSETLVVSPVIEDTKESIGIDQIRALKKFLYQTPVNSRYRLCVIEAAEYMTSQAQHAILKVAEEPPKGGVLILTVSNPDSLMETLKSRFQKIYFPRLSTEEVEKYLIEELNVPKERARETASLSMGRLRRAAKLIKDDEFIAYDEKANDLISGKADWRATAKEMADPKKLENRKDIGPVLENILARLAQDPVRNLDGLRDISRRLSIMAETSANKRLQLEAGLNRLGN